MSVSLFSKHLAPSVLENGLTVAFTNDEDVIAQIQHPSGLPFVPLEDITKVFEEISQDEVSAEVAAVYEMIEVTYVNGRPARGRRRALPLRFPPEIQDVHEAVLHDHHRTNNMGENFLDEFQVCRGMTKSRFCHSHIFRK